MNIDPIDIVTKYRQDPVGFMTDILDVKKEHVWSKIVEMAEAVRDNQFVAIKAGNSVSKSYSMARLALWFLYTHYPSTVVTTAPSNIQVDEILWREIRSAHSNAKIPLGGDCLKTMLDLQKAFGGEKWFATGFATKADASTDQATRVQGFHNKHVLFIMDEAAGIDVPIWEAVDKLITTPRQKLVVIGNPTMARGRFVDCFKSKKFKKITISVLDTPNYQQGVEVIPGLSGVDFVNQVIDTYGKESNKYKAMVTGEIPDEDVDSLIPVSWIERAECRKVDYKFKTLKRFIVWDVADGGDDLHVIKAFENTTEIDEVTVRGKKVEEVEPYVWRLLKQIRGNCIIVDADGIGRVAVGLLEMSNIADVAIIPFSGASTEVIDTERFLNRRHEAHWAMRDMFEKNMISISNNPEQREELASVKLVDEKRGYIAVEKKIDLKKRLGRSPDRGDCIMMMCGCFDEVPIVSKLIDGYKVADDEFESDYYFTPATC